MDFNRISRGGLIVAAAGGLYFIVSFFPWYRACAEGLGVKQCFSGGSGWGTPITLIASLVVVALVAEAVAVESGAAVLPAPGGVNVYKVRIGLAVFVFLAVLLALFVNNRSESVFGASVGTKPGIGIFLALICSAALAYGEYIRNAVPALPPPGNYGGPGGPGNGGPGYGGPGGYNGPGYGGPQSPPGTYGGPTPPPPGYGGPTPPPPGYGGPTPPPPPPGSWNPNA